MFVADHVDEIITIVYQYLHMLKEKGPQRWIYEEVGREIIDEWIC